MRSAWQYCQELTEMLLVAQIPVFYMKYDMMRYTYMRSKADDMASLV